MPRLQLGGKGLRSRGMQVRWREGQEGQPLAALVGPPGLLSTSPLLRLPLLPCPTSSPHENLICLCSWNLPPRHTMPSRYWATPRGHLVIYNPSCPPSQDPLHYPHGTKFLAPGPLGQCHPIPGELACCCCACCRACCRRCLTGAAAAAAAAVVAMAAAPPAGTPTATTAAAVAAGPPLALMLTLQTTSRSRRPWRPRPVSSTPIFRVVKNALPLCYPFLVCRQRAAQGGHGLRRRPARPHLPVLQPAL